ncbi:MAG: hypothetical protein WAU49_14545 [Steroidobacteraceae bacterium]
MRELRRLAPLLTVVALFAGTDVAGAAGACDAFKWDVRHERALFATQAQDQKAGAAVASAPMLSLERLYRLQFAPQNQVAFTLPQGKKPHRNRAYAGLVRLHIAAAGLYRIALSQRFWVDVVSAGKLLDPVAFTGAPGCSSPHKILLYRLAPGDPLLQLSDWPSPQTELTVTRAPDLAPPRH